MRVKGTFKDVIESLFLSFTLLLCDLVYEKLYVNYDFNSVLPNLIWLYKTLIMFISIKFKKG